MRRAKRGWKRDSAFSNAIGSSPVARSIRAGPSVTRSERRFPEPRKATWAPEMSFIQKANEAAQPPAATMKTTAAVSRIWRQESSAGSLTVVCLRGRVTGHGSRRSGRLFPVARLLRAAVPG